MKLFLKNIGIIKEAEVEINGITVIAGDNNTGKSTFGKALFSMFSGFYKIEDMVNNERIKNIEKVLIDLLWAKDLDIVYDSFLGHREQNRKIAKNIISNINECKDNTEQIRKCLVEYYTENNNVSREVEDDIVFQIKEQLNISDTDIECAILKNKIRAEFNGQVENIYNDECGIIKLVIKDREVEIKTKDGDVKRGSNSISLKTEAIYIDDPFILDYEAIRQQFGIYGDHRDFLRRRFYALEKDEYLVKEIVVNNKIQNIMDILSGICGGKIVRNKMSNFGYKTDNSDKTVNIKNISAGMKTFVIIKYLLENQVIENNGTLVLDEPEIHLHPEWQLIFAELIVLLQKEFGLHILLTTHSPYFLRAIQIYSNKYNIGDKCKFYLSYRNDKSCFVDDVSDNVELIYKRLAAPFQKLEDERCSDE